MQKKEIKGRRPNRTTKSTTNKRYTSSKATQIKRRVEQEAEKYFEVEISIQHFGTTSKPAKL